MTAQTHLAIHERRSRTVYPSVALLLMTAAFILTKTGRDALYFQKDGLFDLPWAYLGMAFFSVPVAGLALGVMRSAGTRSAQLVSPLAMAAAQAAFYPLSEPGGGFVMTCFFMVVPLVYGVLFSMAWLLGAELLDQLPSDQLARTYSTLGASSMLGGAIGGMTARLCSDHFDPQVFLLLGAGSLVACVMVMAVAQSRFPSKAKPLAETALPGKAPGSMPPLRDLTSTLREPYVFSMLGVALLASLVGVFVEFQFYLVAATSGAGGRENAGFFANFYLVLGAGALALQIFVMPVLQRRVGIRGSLLVLPAALFSGAAALAVSATGLTRTALRVAEGGLKSSIHRSNWEQTYLPLDPGRRVLVKVLVEGMGTHMAEGMAAGVLLVWLMFFVAGRDIVGLDVSWITYFILLGSVAWIVLTARLKRRLDPDCCPELARGELRPDAPLPDCCRVTATLGENVQRAEQSTAAAPEPHEVRP